MTARIKSIWNFLGDLRLSFYLLLSASVFFLIGSVYTLNYYKFFNGLNEMRIQDWMLDHFASRLSITWWMPVLILLLALLGVNTFICSLNRIVTLIKGGAGGGLRKFFHTMTPSIIHLLFIMVMASHGITFVFGSWERLPLKNGEEVAIEGMPALNVASIEDKYFPEDTGLKKRIEQTEVTLTKEDGEKITVSFLNHVKYGDYHLHLELARKGNWKELQKKEKRIGETVDEDSCNKAPIYHIAKQEVKEKERELRLVAIYDPGLNIIIAGFTLILLLMVWYYIENSVKKNNRTF